MAENYLVRNNKIDPQSMFLTMVNLVTSTNRDGSTSALRKAWSSLNKNMYQTPVKSSFSESRSKLSFTFFKDIFEEDLTRSQKNKKTFRGYRIFAVDGSDLDLPASTDVLKSGFRGSPWSEKFETHYPKMHVLHAYDVINGTVELFKHSTFNSEKALAADIPQVFAKKSISIYDRLYCGLPVFKAHADAGNLFLVRATTEGKRIALCIQEFLASNKVDQEVIWKPKKLAKSKGIPVRLIKTYHPKTKKISVFVTNAPATKFSRLDLGRIYLKRWEIESSFKDLVSTLKLDQWHSTKINGILQEIYCLLWTANAVKLHLHATTICDDIFSEVYSKSNFKKCIQILVENLKLLIFGRRTRFFEIFNYWISRTRERRRHRSRSYPRVVRIYGTGFSAANKVLRSSRDP